MNYKTGMFFHALAFLLGVVFVQQLTHLPTQSQWLTILAGLCLFILIAVLAINCSGFFNNKFFTLTVIFIILFMLGFLSSLLYAKKQLSYRLNEALVGKNIIVNGYVASIPVLKGHVQRFEFYVESHRIMRTGNKTEKNVEAISISEAIFNSEDLSKSDAAPFPRKIRLSWYYGRTIKAADKWQFVVRLKPPHGFINPGGFDYEAWLFQHGIHATGYVRNSTLNIQQSSVSEGLSISDRSTVDMTTVDLSSTDSSWLAKITSLRQRLGQQIDILARQQQGSAKKESFAMIKALAIGDKSSLSKQQWRVLANTGTSHLMAISGLHIGLAALFAYVLLRRSIPVTVIKRIPAQHVAFVGGLFVALLYALIAGFSIPTQRAFIMLFVLVGMMLIRRNHRPVDSLGFALILVLLIDPLAVLSAGFWFSFSAVAVIFISLSSTNTEHAQQAMSLPLLLFNKVVFTAKKWLRLQFLISLFLLPLSLFMFQQVSLISPLANLLLIPYVSFLVVPLVLLAICFAFIVPDFSALLFTVSATLLELIWPVLSYFSAQPYALWVQGDVDIVILLLAMIALFLLFFSKPVANKIAAKLHVKQHLTKVHSVVLVFSLMMLIPLLMPVFINKNSDLKLTEYKVTVLDVGQGSAAILQTTNHVLLFDTGAMFSDKFDAGSSVIIPYFRSQGIRSIERLVVSHGDNDHIGGAQAVIDSYLVFDIMGQNIELLQAQYKQACVQGIKWRWDGVDFEFLSPDNNVLSKRSNIKNNNLSCVLRVSSQAGSLLFTGDIEKKVEMQLLKKFNKRLKSDVLIVPHHGSQTSSSQAFINAVGAKYALFSVGFNNRYKLPSDKVISRYLSSGARLLRTDSSGAITVRFLIDVDQNDNLDDDLKFDLGDGQDYVQDDDSNDGQNSGLSVESYRNKQKKYWHHILDKQHFD